MLSIEEEVKAKIKQYEDLYNYDGPGKIVGWKEYLKSKESEAELTPMVTGHSELDFLVGGFQPGEVIIVTGIKGNGKTLFLQTITNELCKRGNAGVVFSYENNPRNWLSVFKKEREKTGRDIKLYVPESLNPGSLEWLEKRIIESYVKHSINFVMVDHLHYVVDMSTMKLAQDIGAIIRRLVTLAKEFNIVIFIVSHQKVLPDTKAEPSLDTCKDSSAIGQECATGIVVHRVQDDTVTEGVKADSYDQGLCFVKIDKARRTGTYRKKIWYQKRGDWLVPSLGNQEAEHDNGTNTTELI